MSKKRRMFDIDMPDESPEVTPETFPAEKVSDDRGRRGPMATAIAETAVSARERADIEAQIRAENDALAHEHVRLKKLGLVVELIPIDHVETDKLVRDRIKGPDMELAELKASIAELGLSNPIRVEAREDGRYELIQGYRRLAAFTELLAETGDADRYSQIPAAVSVEGDAIEDLYRKMVDENLVRKDISFAEMARLALDYAADPQTAENDPDRAVKALFKSASYSKRSYIRSFITVMRKLQGVIAYPAALPRSLGLSLAAALEEDETLLPRIKAKLADWENRSELDELGALREALGAAGSIGDDDPKPRPKAAKQAGVTSKAKTSFQFDSAAGAAKCTASAGRLEIRLDKDFSTVDRRTLEAAVREMLDRIR
ncbi:ParB N-terminal domain-containing protein [uncultured Maritimibacter sp.]|jgi:ParB family chromosome partitioning protein|uniref:ParB/RepB/Spo0J family partition protein n=1 Tax=uncultured Maritimibacter sp. TaxID=991866 RepID=UPI000A93A995|nr:ParB N-terminal domain-containing protein [uncultured Maritimibacter sp.]